MTKKRQKLIVIWILTIFVVLALLMIGTTLALTVVSEKLHFVPAAEENKLNALQNCAENIDNATIEILYDVSELSKQIYWRRLFDRIYYLQDRMDILYQEYSASYPDLEYIYLVNRQGRVMAFEPWNVSNPKDTYDRNELYDYTRYFQYIHRGSKTHLRGMLYHYLMDDDLNADGNPDDGLIPDIVRQGRADDRAYIWRARYAHQAPFLWPYQIDDLDTQDRARFQENWRRLVKTEAPQEHNYLDTSGSPFVFTEPPPEEQGIVSMPYLMAASYMWDKENLSLGFIGFVLNWNYLQNIIDTSLAAQELDVFIIHNQGVLVSTPSGDTTHSGEYIGWSSEFQKIAQAAANTSNHRAGWIKNAGGGIYYANLECANWILVGIPKKQKVTGIASVFSNIAFWLLGLLFLEVVLFIILVIIFNRFAVEPWRAFAQRLREQKTMPHAIEMRGIDEYDDVAELTNKYLADLEKYHIFGRPMSTKLMEAYKSNPKAFQLGGGEKEASVLYLKIQNFVALEQALSPKKVIEVINRFYQHIEPIISLNNGYVEKLAGDSITILFGVPIDDPNHADRAVNCVTKIIQEIGTFNDKVIGELNNIPLMIGLGIATGTVFCGQMKTPQGNYYSVVGQTMLLAQQFESIAKNKVAIFSDVTIKQASTKPPITQVVTIKVRDIAHPIKVHVMRG